MDTLIVGVNAGGFFSNCNILLSNIIIYFNNYQKLPLKITTNNLLFFIINFYIIFYNYYLAGYNEN
jgi:hypothetical protein